MGNFFFIVFLVFNYIRFSDAIFIRKDDNVNAKHKRKSQKSSSPGLDVFRPRGAMPSKIPYGTSNFIISTEGIPHRSGMLFRANKWDDFRKKISRLLAQLKTRGKIHGDPDNGLHETGLRQFPSAPASRRRSRLPAGAAGVDFFARRQVAAPDAAPPPAPRRPFR
jgi:hypothetical protein